MKGIDRLTGVMSYEKFRMEALRLLKRKKKGLCWFSLEYRILQESMMSTGMLPEMKC